MAQVGLNMGPRNARVLGFAKSYKKNVNGESKGAHDRDAVGGISLVVHKYMPQEIIEMTNNRLKDLKLPELTTQNPSSGILLDVSYTTDTVADSPPDNGYVVRIGDDEIIFPVATRAPPEGYLTHLSFILFLQIQTLQSCA